MNANAKPPYNVDAERAVLGSMLLRRQACETAMFAVSSDDFYIAQHRWIFDEIAALFRQGLAVDHLSVAGHLERKYPRRDDQTAWLVILLGCEAACPSSYNADSYMALISDLGACRRGDALALTIREHARSGEIDAMMDAFANYERVVAAPPPPVPESIDLDALVAMTFDRRFIVPGVLRRLDRFMLTGLEGISGKSEFLFQWAVMFASGVHPWTQRDDEYAPLRVLYIDCENELDQLQPRASERLRAAAGDRYGGNLFIESRTVGINLCAHPDQMWLEAMVERHAPDVLFMGPLYNLFRALPGHRKHDEETAETFGDVVKRLAKRHDLAVLMEAHAPLGKDGDRADFRPYGASYWLRWPEIGVGLKPRTRWQGRQKIIVPGEFDFVFWRGTRDRDIRRPFPSGVRRSRPWSFACDDEEVL